MFDNALTLVALTVIVMTVLFAFYSRFMKARAENPSDSIPETILNVTSLLRGHMLVAFNKAIELKKADERGFDSVKEFVLDQIMEFVQGDGQLTKEQKALLSPQMVDAMITPHLKALWDYKLEMPGKNMTKATLERIREEKKQNGE
jgi:uncharacterized membrane protein YsdA (DUF1294 family)